MDSTAPLLSSFGRIQMHVLEEYGLSEKQVLAAAGLSKGFLDEPFYTYGDMFALLDYGYSVCLLYTSPSPRDRTRSRMPSSA